MVEFGIRYQKPTIASEILNYGTSLKCRKKSNVFIKYAWPGIRLVDRRCYRILQQCSVIFIVVDLLAKASRTSSLINVRNCRWWGPGHSFAAPFRLAKNTLEKHYAQWASSRRL